MKGGRLFVVVATLLVAQVARAEPSSSLRVEADRLFEEGRGLMAEGSVAEACDRFSESLQRLPRPGTELNLAVCLEKKGELVAAVRHFRGALAAAVRDGRSDREEIARTHLARLQPRLAWLHLQTEPSGAQEVLVFVDGQPVAAAAEQPLPLEPGTRAITAQSAGYRDHRTELSAVAGSSHTVVIPALVPLEPAPTVAAIPPQAAAPIDRAVPSPRKRNGAGSERRIWGLALLGTGTATVAVGAIFGIHAVNLGDELASVCPGLSCTSQEAMRRGRQLSTDGGRAALVANVALPLGLLLDAAGAYLLATGDSRAAPAIRASSPPGVRLGAEARKGSLAASVRMAW